jgi:hypothetical protein
MSSNDRLLGTVTRIGVLAALAVGAAFVLAGVARAGGRLVRIGAPVARLVADGERYAAWQRGDVVTVWDSRTKTRQTLGDTGGCSLADLASATVLLACDQSGTTVNLRTGERALLPALTVSGGQTEAFASYSQIGRSWALVQVSDGRGGYPVYVDRDKPMNAPIQLQPIPSQTIDLNLPGLTRNFCSPVQAPDQTDGLVTRQASVAYKPPYAAALSDSGGENPVSRLLLWRCGHNAQVLDRCTCGPQLGGGFIIWSHYSGAARRPAQTTIYARKLSNGRTRSWTVSPRQTGPIAHVGNRLLVASSDGLLSANLEPAPR